jgi:hypothetical protein
MKAARSVETKYITTIIDGFVAEWNASGNGGEYNGPPIAQKDVEHLRVQFGPDAERRYGVCPGVATLLIETKSGSWRPNAAKSP